MENTQTAKQFDFGQNWKNFSNNKLNEQKIRQAQIDFLQLVKELEIKDKKFIDIGFGQGLGLLTSKMLGAESVGVDINKKCEETLLINTSYFPELKNEKIPVIIGSILDYEIVKQIKTISENYDIVHSWGVLHHTGNMWKAIDNCCQLVNPTGKIILAIYNRHWSSKFWNFIKKLYNYSPTFLKKIIVYLFYVIIAIAKYMVTFKNPFIKERGMSFYYDVIDWIGGYPYEYASKTEIIEYLKSRGFKLFSFKPASVPTGCNEYIFEKYIIV